MQSFCSILPAIGDTTVLTTKGPKQHSVAESAFEEKKGTKTYDLLAENLCSAT